MNIFYLLEVDDKVTLEAIPIIGRQKASACIYCWVPSEGLNVIYGISGLLPV